MTTHSVSKDHFPSLEPGRAQLLPPCSQHESVIPAHAGIHGGMRFSPRTRSDSSDYNLCQIRLITTKRRSRPAEMREAQSP